MTTDAPSAAPPVPERIRAARELRGLTQRAVVAAMAQRISTAALSQIESGTTRPSPATLAELADVLEVPIGFFSAQWPQSGKAVTFFRDLRATSARERRRAAASALLLTDLVAAVEQYVRLPDLSLPKVAIDVSSTRHEIEVAAQQVRAMWSLEQRPIDHVVRTLERHGIVVARLEVGTTSVDAFSTTLGRRPLVVLGSDKTYNYVRSRFDAAHELAHLLFHRDVAPGTKTVETQAHDFAASLLFPEGVARAELPERIDAAGWARLANLKRVWGISIAALLFRARALRVIGPDAYQNAMRYMSSRGWRTTEPGDREMGAPEAPLLLERSIRRAEVEAGIRLGELVSRAHLPVEDALRLAQTSFDKRPVVEL